MKFKHVFATLGLASVMALGVGVALAHKGEMKAAKAEDPSWMFRVQLTDQFTDETRKDFELTDFRFHCWGTGGLDKTVSLMKTGSRFSVFDYYGANINFYAGQEVEGCQFIMKKNGVDYWSNDIVLSASSASHYVQYGWAISGESTTAAKWNVYNEQTNSELKLTYTDAEDVPFVEDPANNVFRVDNWTISQGESETNIYSRYVTLNAGAMNRELFYEAIDADSKTLFYNGSVQWASFKEYGTYDFILCGDNGFAGYRVHKHAVSQSSYVYYVTDSADPTNNYAYTFGATQAFGAWPGSKVTDVGTEVTGGVVHFQNRNVRIYKIELNIGNGCDDQIIFNYQGEPKSQSANLYLKPGTALWWSSEYNYTNDQAGKALDLIVRLESIRNAVEADDSDPLHPIRAYSVCGISVANAASLVNEYLGLSASTRETYIDCSKVLTYKDNSSADEMMVSYADIMAYLAKVADIDLNSNNIVKVNQNTATIIVVVISAIAIISLAGACFIIRKRKHQ